MDQREKGMWIQTLWDPLQSMHQSPLHSPKEGIKVAAYCRVSLDSLGISESLRNQLSHYTHLIRTKPNWKFVGIYFDNLVSGRKADVRQGFTRMLRHCEEGKIDLILVKNVSRFSRNTKELIEIVNRLKEINVTVFFESENIESTREDSTYLLQTYAGMAQAEIEASSKSIEWGHEKRFMKGIPLIGNLYGYEKVKTDGRTTVRLHEEQANVVREIYAMYLEGTLFNRIASILTQRKIKTRFGKDLWAGAIVKSILSNIAYTGNFIARAKTKDLLTCELKPSDEIRTQYYIENSHPAIIGQDVFNQVQKRLQQNKKNVYPRKPRVWPLFRRIICGNCGRNFQVNRQKPHNYYKCAKNKSNVNLCASSTFREDKIFSMMLHAFEIRFDLSDQTILKKLFKIVKHVNQNDHFEFHRLKALTAIDMAKELRGIKFSDEDIKEMEDKYKDFEKRLVKIEDDRKYRNEAISWMQGISSIKEFKEQITIELMRAWILEMVAYSEEDFLIRWIDGVESEKGDCTPVYREPSNVENNYNQSGMKSTKETVVFEDMTLVKGATSIDSNIELDKGEIDENLKGKEDSGMDVIKIESETPNTLIKQLKKSIQSGNVISIDVPAKTKKTLRVSAYVRVSTEQEQQMLSLKTQTAYYTYAILRNSDYHFVGIYADEGITGTSTKDRKEFNRMIEDCKAGKIDLIITKSISRFSRNTVDVLRYIQMLQALEPPVDIWFEKENLKSDDSRSQFLITLQGAIGQEESVNLSQSISWAKRSMARRGVVHPAQLGYGYRYGRNKDWVIVEEEAAIVRRIYKDYLDGCTLKEIARRLTKDRVPAIGAQRDWCIATVRRILVSEIYRGNYIYQRFYTDENLEKKRLKNNGELPIYYIEDHHPPIIDSQQWEAVQSVFASREKKRREKFKKYPKDENKTVVFSKKLYCSDCGALISYARNINKQKIQCYYWCCRNALQQRCDAPSFFQEYIKENFVQMLVDLQSNPAFPQYLSQLNARLNITQEEESEREKLTQEMEALNQELYTTVKDELGKNGKDVKRVDALTEEIVNLKNRLNSFTEREEQIEAIQKEVGLLLKEIGPYEKMKKDANDYYKKGPKFQGELFERFIEEGIVHKDGKIVFHFKSRFQWSAPIVYENFKKKKESEKAAKREAEKEKYFNGPEVQKLLAYCKEPKSLVELHNLLGKYSVASTTTKNIINPLLESGKLKRTLPGKPSSKYQRYYSGEKPELDS